jgi:hypothetical protein
VVSAGPEKQKAARKTGRLSELRKRQKSDEELVGFLMS